MPPRKLYEDVFNHFKQSNCQLLTTYYTDNNQKLEYICSCGKAAKTIFRNVSGKKVRCKNCSAKEVYNNRKLNCKTNDKFIYASQRGEYFINKYGVKSISSLPRIKEKIKLTNLERYGVEYVFQAPHVISKIQNTLDTRYDRKELYKKCCETIQQRYGVKSPAYLSRNASKSSQLLFWNIYSKLPEEYKTHLYFAQLNSEFVTTYLGNNYKFDFVQTTLKKAIEYNGSKFHPQSHQNDDEVGWCVFHPAKTVKEAREYEKVKYHSLELRNYTILTVWDFEEKDYDTLLSKCIEFLLN